jgi:hypothetical protein
VNPDESLEIGPRKFKRLGDCTGSELEAAIRLIAGRRIDRAWIDQQASGSDRDGLTIGRRFFASVTEPERDLIAYWQMVKLVDEQRRNEAKQDDARRKDDRTTARVAGERLIDQALAAVVASDALGPDDQISLTEEQALVWAIYLRVIARHRGLASDEEIEHSVNAGRERGISTEEIDAAIAAGHRPEAREEN